LAERNGLRGVRHVDDVRRAARLGGVDVAKLEPHVVGHRQAAQAGRVPRAEVAVHIAQRQPGIGESAVGRFGVRLCERLCVRLARGMLEDASDAGLVLDAHRTSPPSHGSALMRRAILLPPFLTILRALRVRTLLFFFVFFAFFALAMAAPPWWSLRTS